MTSSEKHRFFKISVGFSLRFDSIL